MGDNKDNKDNRGMFMHLVHAGGHLTNAWAKEVGFSGIETTKIYKSVSPGKAAKGPWDKKVDYKRADYHFNEAFKKKKWNLLYYLIIQLLFAYS